MKYLQDYVNEPQEKLFERLGVFFAFNDQQVKEQIDPTVTKYVNMGGGMVCPEVNARTLILELSAIHKTARLQDVADNGRTGVIKRELYNHECFYTGDYDTVVDKLEAYGITLEEVRTAFNDEYETASQFN